MIKLKNKKAAVLGTLGPGQAAVKFLYKQGAEVTLIGVATELDLQRIRKNLKGISFEYHSEKITRDHLKSFEVVVLTPGGGRLFADQVEEARKSGATVLTELDLALMFLRAPLIAVTGTNGKTTVVHIIRSILERAGKKVFAAGGEYAEYCDAALIPGKIDYFVFEVNSSRLARVKSISPGIAVLLNIYSGHTERHDSFREYAEAKAKIFRDQTPEQFLVFPAQSKEVVDLVKEKNARAHLVPFSFAPLRHGIYTDIPQKKYIYTSEKEEKSFFDYSNLSLIGTQNIQNAMVGAGVAKLCGINDDIIQQGLVELQAPPDRMEPLQKINGIQYINDARASNAVATESALHGFPKQSVILIAGGAFEPLVRDKGLHDMIKQKARCLIIFGTERRRFFEVWGNLTETYVVPELKDAVELASNKAGKGEIVLFSPAVRPELHTHGSPQKRGEDFRRCVKEVAELQKAHKILQRRI